MKDTWQRTWYNLYNILRTVQYTTYIKTRCNNYNYNLIVIIASCLDVRYVLTVRNILYKFDIHNGMASLKFIVWYNLQSDFGNTGAHSMIQITSKQLK